jgi:hypothetical protein
MSRRKRARGLGVVFALLVAGCGATAGGPARGDGAGADGEVTWAAVPEDLARRGAELLRVDCPEGTRLVERAEWRGHEFEIHRHCETEDGERRGTLVDYRGAATSTYLYRRGQRAGRRDGPYVRIADGFVTETTFAAGIAVGTFRRRTTAGRTLVEGAFDEGGQLHGTWRFWSRDGTLLGESVMEHGTGVIEIWDGARVPPRALARLSCREGVLDGESWFRRELDGATLWGASEYEVRATYADGIPHGPWQRTAAGHVERGQYDHGEPRGDWDLVDPGICFQYEMQGCVQACAVPLQSATYRCLDVTGPTCDHPEVGGRDATLSPAPVSGAWPGPHPMHERERCELPPGFLD